MVTRQPSSPVKDSRQKSDARQHARASVSRQPQATVRATAQRPQRVADSEAGKPKEVAGPSTLAGKGGWLEVRRRQRMPRDSQVSTSADGNSTTSRRSTNQTRGNQPSDDKKRLKNKKKRERQKAKLHAKKQLSQT